jgi:hypothetical protein
MDTYIWIIIGAPLLFLFMRTAFDLFTGYRAYRRVLDKNDPDWARGQSPLMAR